MPPRRLAPQFLAGDQEVFKNHEVGGAVDPPAGTRVFGQRARQVFLRAARKRSAG